MFPTKKIGATHKKLHVTSSRCRQTKLDTPCHCNAVRQNQASIYYTCGRLEKQLDDKITYGSIALLMGRAGTRRRAQKTRRPQAPIIAVYQQSSR